MTGYLSFYSYKRPWTLVWDPGILLGNSLILLGLTLSFGRWDRVSRVCTDSAHFSGRFLPRALRGFPSLAGGSRNSSVWALRILLLILLGASFPILTWFLHTHRLNVTLPSMGGKTLPIPGAFLLGGFPCLLRFPENTNLLLTSDSQLHFQTLPGFCSQHLGLEMCSGSLLGQSEGSPGLFPISQGPRSLLMVSVLKMIAPQILSRFLFLFFKGESKCSPCDRNEY